MKRTAVRWCTIRPLEMVYHQSRDTEERPIVFSSTGPVWTNVFRGQIRLWFSAPKVALFHEEFNKKKKTN